MKKLLLPVAVATMFFTSCGGDPCGDPQTAEDAASCMCELGKEYKAAHDAEDEDGMKEVDGKMEEFGKKLEKLVEEEKFTEEDYLKAILDSGCDAG